MTSYPAEQWTGIHLPATWCSLGDTRREIAKKWCKWWFLLWTHQLLVFHFVLNCVCSSSVAIYCSLSEECSHLCKVRKLGEYRRDALIQYVSKLFHVKVPVSFFSPFSVGEAWPFTHVMIFIRIISYVCIHKL